MDGYQGFREAPSSRKLKRQRRLQYSPTFSDSFEEEGGYEYSMELKEGKESEVEQQEEERKLESAERSEHEDQLQQILEQESTSEEEEINQEDSLISLTLTDPGVLNCVICFEHLGIPVYQCENGHPFCHSCYLNLQKNNCPICSVALRNNRCYGIERILEALKIPCPNKKYGCKEKVSYIKINNEDNEHEKSCIYEPCSCPHPRCNFLASSKDLSLHYSRKHKDSGIRFVFGHYHRVLMQLCDDFLVFQEENEGVLLILNIQDRDIGRRVNISSIGPKSSKQRFKYEIRAEFLGSSVKFRSSTWRNVTSPVADQEFSNFLLIPCGFFGHYPTIELEICINKA